MSVGQALLEIAYDGPHELVVFPGEENLADLKPGAPALASADAFPGRTFDARVSLIAPTVDASQGTVEVRLAMDDPPAYLLPGMTVSVNITTGRRAGALVLPEEAVQGLGTDRPWVGVPRDGRLEQVGVETGLRAEGFVEVLAGLEPDARVARSPSAGLLRDRVRVLGSGAAGR